MTVFLTEQNYSSATIKQQLDSLSIDIISKIADIIDFVKFRDGSNSEVTD